ncbi:MAG: glycerol-3-phosphate 1-O-acyltransferase PlsY [Candidatus Omnitrophica bacterium]|nr:glycerol-3-phosphate 1-O-acyltransferase PlsY [Candidatus Omnitrophota bacterium]
MFAYLLGAVPFGYVIGKIKKVDIRKSGSGNIGATNALRAMGKTAGAAVLLLDLLKGALAVIIAGKICSYQGAACREPVYIYLAGLAAITGHIYTPFLGFRGGKGVATTLGVLIGLCFWVSGAGKVLSLLFIFWLFVVVISKYVSLGSILAAAGLPVCFWIFIKTPASIFFGVITGGLIIWRHKGNIRRLIDKREKRLKL